MFVIAEWMIVIDTDAYSGNFEREMCGYCTGANWEYAEEEFVNMYRNDFGIPDDEDSQFQDVLIHIMNEHGASEPCSIFPTPGFFNNGMGGHFRDDDEENAREHLIAAHLKESENNICVHPDDKEKHEKRWKDDAEEAKTKPLVKFPAYQSVAIFFYDKPTKDQMKTIIDRSLKFKKVYEESKSYLKNQGPNVIAVRLIHTELVQKETFVYGGEPRTL